MAVRSRSTVSAPERRSRGLWRRDAAALMVASAAAIEGALFLGCTDDRLSPSGGRAPRSATTGESGAGGAAGAAPGPEPDAGAPPANLCECVAAYGGRDGPCADCFNEHTAEGARCAAPRARCAAEPSCLAISRCLKECGREVDCQRSCVFPDDAGASELAYWGVLTCVCAECGATCAYGEPLECSAVDAGGSGAAGAGGAGGSGAMGGGGAGG